MGAAKAGRAGTKGVPRQLREEQILAAATREFGTHGYAGVSMTDIAGRIGVTKPLLYHYFGSKDGLYLACLRRVGAELTEAIVAAMPASTTTPETPLAVLRALFTTLDGRRHAWFVLYDQTLPATGETADAARRYRDKIDQLAGNGAADLLRSRGLRDPLDVSALKQLWTGIVSSLVGWWIRHPETSAREMAERCDRLFIAVLSPPAPR